MALVPSQVNGQWVLSGMTQDPNVLAPLGRYYFQQGPHFIGFDDSFAEPVIVRAYYDTSADADTRRALDRRALTYVGYVQFMRLAFRGMDIPPDVYGGRLADRTPYVYGPDLKFLDFMGPAEARVRGLTTPAYPFNAMLTDGSLLRNDQFMRYPLANGCLCGPASQVPGTALGAALVGEIAPGLITPAHIAPMLNDGNLLLSVTVTSAEAALTEPYRIALNALESQPLPEAPDAPPPLLGLDESGIAAQVIGDYVLLTLPGPENFDDTLVISTQAAPDRTTVLVHLLSDYDLEDLTGRAGREALLRINDYQIDQGLTTADQMDLVPPDGRGMSGLLTPPYSTSPDEYVLELRYWTVLIGAYRLSMRNRDTRHVRSAISWAALFTFDEDTGLMNFAAIRQPTTAIFGLAEGLAAYQSAYDAPTGAIDVSNFTKAAMRLENFAGGSKVSFVNFLGRPLV